MFSSVDLPHPDGPRMHTNSPGLTVNVAPSSAFQPPWPLLPGNVLLTLLLTADGTLLMRSIAARGAVGPAVSSQLTARRPPPEQAGFELAEHDDLEEQHDEQEQERVRQHFAHVEHLVIELDLVADAVAAPEKLDEQRHLPDQAEAEPRRGHQGRRDLRCDDREDDPRLAVVEGARHVDQLLVDALD